MFVYQRMKFSNSIGLLEKYKIQGEVFFNYVVPLNCQNFIVQLEKTKKNSLFSCKINEIFDSKITFWTT